jgi:hypothetical protein
MTTQLQICESWHSATKSLLRATGNESQRIDRLIYYLLEEVAELIEYRNLRARHGMHQAAVHYLLVCVHGCDALKVHACVHIQAFATTKTAP